MVVLLEKQDFEVLQAVEVAFEQLFPFFVEGALQLTNTLLQLIHLEGGLRIRDFCSDLLDEPLALRHERIGVGAGRQCERER